MQIATAFRITPQIKKEIIEIIDERVEKRYILTLREDFSELKGIVQNLGINVGELAIAQKELAIAQKKSEERLTRVEINVGELAIAQKELAIAQKKSEERLTRVEIVIEELAEAQKRTEIKVEELAQAQKRTEIEIQKLTGEVQGLTKGLKLTREDLGGLSRSFSYGFENEAYRMLPGFLKDNYGIEMTERIIRTEVGGKEINIFGKAKRNGTNLLIVGEAKIRLEKKRDKKRDVFKELEEKVGAVKKISQEEIIKILLTHYATPWFLEKAKEKDIIVIQSFEW